MPKMKNCPVCDQPIKLENLKKHIKKVHPRTKVDVDYTEKEEKSLREHEQRQKELTKPTGLWKYAVIISVIIIALVAVTIYYPTSNVGYGILKPGTPLKDFTVTDTNGNTITLSDWEGEVIYIDFFQTKCDACRTNTPRVLVPIYQQYGTQIKMLSISINDQDTVQDLKDFKKEFNAQWSYALDTSGIQQMYGVTHTPTGFLINREGVISYSHVGVDDISALTAEIVKIL